ncbi:hypothetical protein J2S66_006724 [Saccharothrix longispora]|uniref:Uncharacterized protein n=1 Tax=Saccharothrix longispora TaxID=33920 RepID=A0ABU1Q616_9PSEU|nr:hypothetical protein [Saccharothrix longispora]
MVLDEVREAMAPAYVVRVTDTSAPGPGDTHRGTGMPGTVTEPPVGAS